MRKCTGKNCPMKQGYDTEQCKVVEFCGKRTESWGLSRGNLIRGMSDAQIARVLVTRSSCYCRDNKVCHEILDGPEGIPIEKCIVCAIDWLRDGDDGTLDV